MRLLWPQSFEIKHLQSGEGLRTPWFKSSSFNLKLLSHKFVLMMINRNKKNVTLVESKPLSCRLTATSKKVVSRFVSLSTVNWIDGSMLDKCCCRVCSWLDFTAIHTSSTYRFQKHGWRFTG